MTPLLKLALVNLSSSSSLEDEMDSLTGDEEEILQIYDSSSSPPTGEKVEVYDIPFWMAVLLSLVYLVVSFCAVIGNWMVLWIVIRSKVMRNVTNLFIANLAVADIIIGAFAIPFQFQAALLQKWLLPFFMCSFCPTVQVVSLNVSIFTLVTLSVDRHRAVTQPLKPRISKSTGYTIIAAIWLVSIVAAIPTFLAFRITFRHISHLPIMPSTDLQSNLTRGHEESILVSLPGSEEELSREESLEPMCWPTGLNEDFWRTYNHLLVALQYMLPIIVISIAYIHMAIVLWTGSGIMNESRTESVRANHSKRRVIKMLFIVIAIFAICWLPFQAYNILQEIYPRINDYKFINLIWFSCHLFAMSNSCYNPFIYAIYGEKFNQEFRQRFYCCCFWAAHVNDSSATATGSAGTVLRSQDASQNNVYDTSVRQQQPLMAHKSRSFPLNFLTSCRNNNNGFNGNGAADSSTTAVTAFDAPPITVIPSSPSCAETRSIVSSPSLQNCSSPGSGKSLESTLSPQRHKKHLLCKKRVFKAGDQTDVKRKKSPAGRDGRGIKSQEEKAAIVLLPPSSVHQEKEVMAMTQPFLRSDPECKRNQGDSISYV